MLRTLRILGLCSALAAGCSKPAAEAPPAPGPAENVPGPETAAAKEAAASGDPSRSKAVVSPPPATAAGPAPIRDLAAKLLESDGGDGWRTNEAAATALEKLGDEGTAQLWSLLKDPSADVRRGAAFQLLGEFNPANREQIAAMSELLDDEDRTVRGLGLAAVKQMLEADQKAAVPRLANMLRPDREPKAANRAAIARLFGTLKQEGAAGLPALLDAAAGDPEVSVRSACLMAISQVARPDQAVVPLVKGLADKDTSPRLVAAARLRQLGPAAAPAAKELAAALSDSEARVAEVAAEALINIGEAAVAPLTAQLAASNVNARRFALACLAKIGPPASSAASAIEKCKQDADPQVRQLAEAALRRVGGK